MAADERPSGPGASARISLGAALALVWSLIALALAVRYLTGSEVWSGVALLAGAALAGSWRVLRRSHDPDRHDLTL